MQASAIPEMIMLVGLPGSGKSTWAAKQPGYIVHSSDAVRASLPTENRQEDVFSLLYKNLRADLKAGRSCIFDATNMSRKKRRGFLAMLRNVPCRKVCVLFLAPLAACVKRNAGRTGVACVPDYVFRKMLTSFYTPCLEEGFDEIRFVTAGLDEPLTYDGIDLAEFGQDNHHHALTLGDHMRGAGEYIERFAGPVPEGVRLDLVREAAYWHDIGKVYTKDYRNARGEETSEAHYFGHNNAGAYVYLLHWARDITERKMPFYDALHVACLIDMHMCPYLSWKESEKSAARDRGIFGSAMVREVYMVHDADVNAH